TMAGGNDSVTALRYYGVVRGGKTMPSLPCPSADELRAFAVGNVTETALARIAGHVEGCRDCEAQLQAFDSASDGLVASLRHLTEPRGHESVTPPPDLLPAARRAAASPANGSGSEISIDSGRRYARQLATGDCRLGKFELEAELGAGSFGYVFRARDTELERTVAVKIQRAGSLAND